MDTQDILKDTTDIDFFKISKNYVCVYDLLKGTLNHKRLLYSKEC